MKNRYKNSFDTASDDTSDYWLKEFEKNLKKSAVQSKEKDDSLFNQINYIMHGTKSKYSSVAEAVEEMKNRAGLTAYLEKIKLSENDKVKNKKTASVNANMPDIFTENPQVKTTIENYIRSTKGNVPIPAILEKINSIHKNDISDDAFWEDEKLLRFISSMNLKEKSNNPMNFQNYNNLGTQDNDNSSTSDEENNDAFHHLMPSSD